MDQRYTKPIFGRYRLHSLHGQFCGHQFLIPDLKAFKVFTSFNSVSTISQILGPKNDRLSQFHYIHFQQVELNSAKCGVAGSLDFVY